MIQGTHALISTFCIVVGLLIVFLAGDGVPANLSGTERVGLGCMAAALLLTFLRARRDDL